MGRWKGPPGGDITPPITLEVTGLTTPGRTPVPKKEN